MQTQPWQQPSPAPRSHFATYGDGVRRMKEGGRRLKPWGQVWCGEAPTPLPLGRAATAGGCRTSHDERVPRSSVMDYPGARVRGAKRLDGAR